MLDNTSSYKGLWHGWLTKKIWIYEYAGKMYEHQNSHEVNTKGSTSKQPRQVTFILKQVQNVNLHKLKH